MKVPKTRHPHLDAIGSSLERSLERHLVRNRAVRSAYAELAFEIKMAQQLVGPATETGRFGSRV